MSILEKITNIKPIGFLKNLIDKAHPYSTHRIVNLTWGLGSFVAYWIDHFWYKRIFVNSDYYFIASMAGIMTIAAIGAKSQDAPVVPEVTESENVDKQ